MLQPQLETPRFLDDFRAHLRRRLRQLGFADAGAIEETDPRPIESIYFQATSRLIEPRPRRVHEARNFKVAGTIGRKYYALRHKIRQGEDLRPYQSSRILSASATDDYLARWGIHHLHLGTFLLDNGLVERTGPILLGIFHPTDAYVIGIESDAQGHGSPWNDPRHLNTVVDNWPHLFREFEEDPTGIDPTTTGGPVNATSTMTNGPLCAATTSAGDLTNVLVEHSRVVLSNGKAYRFWGGGITSEGTSARGVALARHWLSRVAEAEKAATAGFAGFVEAAKGRGVSLPDRVQLRLEVADRLHGRIDDTNWLWLLEPAIPVTILDRKRLARR